MRGGAYTFNIVVLLIHGMFFYKNMSGFHMNFDQINAIFNKKQKSHFFVHTNIRYDDTIGIVSSMI